MICRNILRFVCFIVPILPHINGIVISRNNACNNRYPYARVVPSINTRTAVQSVVSNNNHIQDATDSSLLRRRAFTKAISVFASTIFVLQIKVMLQRNEMRYCVARDSLQTYTRRNVQTLVILAMRVRPRHCRIRKKHQQIHS